MLRVILADDEQYERNYLEKVIKESYPGLLEIVYKAVDGMDLMEKLEECKPQIVLLDIKMPRMNGLKTAEEVRKRHPDIQIVLISAYSDFSFAKQAIKLGVTDYLLKPYLDSELRETLDKVIARVREREDTLSMLSYSNYLVEDGKSAFDFYRDLEKDLLWDVFFGRRDRDKLEKEFAMWGVGPGWFKVVLISSPALISMGGFSQEVLKNYFHMARDYLAEERKIPVACGVSGAYEGMERLTEAYGEAASFIREYSAQEARLAFDSMTEGMKRICGLEEQIIKSLSLEDQDLSCVLLTEMIEELETLLGYQDVSVKLNFGRSLMTIIRGINQIPGIRVKTSEAARRFEKLGQLNFNGDNLKYHVEYFSEMKIQRE